MAQYTMMLSRVCELYGREEVESWFKNYKLENYLTPEQIALINKYSVWSKDRLASKIVDHYFMREIGFETPYLFRHYAISTMQEIMEKYLLLIYSKFLEYDPLSNVDYIETYTREIKGNQKVDGSATDKTTNQTSSNSSGTSTSSSTSNSNGLNIDNDTPQTKITKQNLNSGVYASKIGQSESSSSVEDETNTSSENETNSTLLSNSNSSSTGSSNTIETYTHHMEGDNGVIVTNQYLVREFRELVNSFDLDIINNLNTLFMGLY